MNMADLIRDLLKNGGKLPDFEKISLPNT
jgi:hypothetical protein